MPLNNIFVCARVFKSNLDNDFSWGSVFLFFFLFENRNAHITPQNSSRTLCCVFLTNVCLVGKEGTQNHKYKSHITILFLEFVSHLARIGGCLSVHDKGCRAHALELEAIHYWQTETASSFFNNDDCATSELSWWFSTRSLRLLPPVVPGGGVTRVPGGCLTTTFVRDETCSSSLRSSLLSVPFPPPSPRL